MLFSGCIAPAPFEDPGEVGRFIDCGGAKAILYGSVYASGIP